MGFSRKNVLRGSTQSHLSDTGTELESADTFQFIGHIWTDVDEDAALETKQRTRSTVSPSIQSQQSSGVDCSHSHIQRKTTVHTHIHTVGQFRGNIDLIYMMVDTPFTFDLVSRECEVSVSYLGVSTEAGLQEEGEFGVPEGDVEGVGLQRSEDLKKDGWTLVRLVGSEPHLSWGHWGSEDLV